MAACSSSLSICIPMKSAELCEYEFCLMSFFYPPKRLKIGRGQLLTPLYFLTPNRKSNANFVWINSHNRAVLKCLVYIHIAMSLYSKLYGTERLTLSFHPCWWLLWWSSMSLKSYFGESQGCSLFLMKVITSNLGNIAKLSYTKASNTYNKKHVCSLRCLHF